MASTNNVDNIEKTADETKQKRSWSQRFGFDDKTLWNWLQLFSSMLVPFMIGVFTIVTTLQQRQTNHLQRLSDMERNEKQHLNDLNIAQLQELQAAADQRNESVFTTYIKEMSELLGNEEHVNNSRTKKLMRVKTLTALRQLDVNRKLFLIQYLYEWDLIGQRLDDDQLPLIDLTGANLGYVNFSRITEKPRIDYDPPISLYLANVFLQNASFVNLKLGYSDFSRSNLQGANFYYSHL
ncbi:unnamed protein product, partial [Didymodactylos carnosus]